jgi:hypothetical protein
MPETFYSRAEIKAIFDETRSYWIQPYEKAEGRKMPVSPSEMLDILIGSLKDRFGIVDEEPRRLILSLTCYPDSERQYPILAAARAQALKAAFAKQFPDAPKFRESKQNFIESSDWKYFFTGATDEHIQWAKVAKECGMIDSYIVDYDPSWKGN